MNGPIKLPPAEEIREWLRKLEEAGISPWTLAYAQVALEAAKDAATTKISDPDIGDDWGWYDELCSSADAERDDPNDGIAIFYDSVVELGKHLGLPVKEES